MSRYDNITEVTKFNPYHAGDGKFSSGGGSGASGSKSSSGAGESGGSGVAGKAKAIWESESMPSYEKPYKVADLVEEMKIGDRVTCKNYKNGDVMEFEKIDNAGTIADFKNVRRINHMASPQHVIGWVKDSIVYGDYKPTFTEGGTKKV